MSMDAAAPDIRRVAASLNALYLFLIMLVMAAILTAAMYMQYFKSELPCPLCLLQRVCMLGVCFGVMHSFRHGFSSRNEGVSILFTVLLLVISTRQTLLDIYPRPGHSYIGTAIFGIHMPVWSIIIAVALLLAYAIRLAVFGSEDQLRSSPPPRALAKAADILAIFVIAVCAINLVSVILQCGLGECHTFNYKLLQ